MRQRPAMTILRLLQQRAAPAAAELASDRELLHRFANHGDQEAFEAVVRRHGPMVCGVCRRLLQRKQDIEDVFQSTFVVLALKAGQLPWHDSVCNWLYGVALRLARKARGRCLASRETTAELNSVACPLDETREQALRELRHVLDEELGTLPHRYRAPLLLCYLGGHTQDDAASRLGWSCRTLRRRLDAGRQLLRTRLARRGYALSAGAFATFLQAQLVTASVPAALVNSAGSAATRNVLLPARVAELVAAALETSSRGVMTWRLAAILLAVAGMCATMALLPLPAANETPTTPDRILEPIQAVQPAPPRLMWQHAKGVVTITGTPGHDYINPLIKDGTLQIGTREPGTSLVTYVDTGIRGQPKLELRIDAGGGDNVVFAALPESAYASLSIRCGAGDDFIDDSGNRPADIDAGAGANRIRAGIDASIQCGAGKDQITLRATNANSQRLARARHRVGDGPGSFDYEFHTRARPDFTLDTLKALSDLKPAQHTARARWRDPQTGRIETLFTSP